MFLLLASDQGSPGLFFPFQSCVSFCIHFTVLRRAVKRTCHGDMTLPGFLQITSGRISGLHRWVIKYFALLLVILNGSHTISLRNASSAHVGYNS